MAEFVPIIVRDQVFEHVKRAYLLCENRSCSCLLVKGRSYAETRTQPGELQGGLLIGWCYEGEIWVIDKDAATEI